MKKIFIALSVILMIGCDSVPTAVIAPDPWDENGWPVVSITADSSTQTVTRSDTYNLVIDGTGATITVMGGGSVYLWLDGTGSSVTFSGVHTILGCSVSGTSALVELGGNTASCDITGTSATVIP